MQANPSQQPGVELTEEALQALEADLDTIYATTDRVLAAHREYMNSGKQAH